MTPTQQWIATYVLSVLTSTGILLLFKKALAALFIQELALHFAKVADVKRDLDGMGTRIDRAESVGTLSLQQSERAAETGERATLEAKAIRDLLDRLHERIVQDFVEPIRDQGRVSQDMGRSLAALVKEMETQSGLVKMLLDRELKGSP